MMLAPAWRTRLFAAGGALLAIWLGFSIAQEDLAVPLACLAVVGMFLMLRLQPLPIGTVLLGVAIVGYIVGNRGFAQLYIASSLPILPAELMMLVGGTVLIVQSAFRRELPFRRDALNRAIVVWMIITGIRFLFDFRTYGMNGLRDFALVYYAAFFFLAQSAAREARARRYLHLCLAGACALLLLSQVLYQQFPDFFYSSLTFRGTVFFLRFETNRRWWEAALSLVLIAATLSTNNRASMLGLILVTLALLLTGRWRFAAMQAIGGVAALIAILLWAQVSGSSWQKTPLYGLYERVVSITDPLGARSYSGEDTFYKGDNNLFRAVWWRNVLDETLETNPYLGLGFGYSLADRFVREYYTDNSEEFNTRSPHNVLLTLFARTGLVGFLPFLIILGLMAARTYRALRRGSAESTMLWCGAWIIFVSACFGVVLEGPMGAVVFWIMLGWADATSRPPEDTVLPAEIAASPPAALQTAERTDEVAV